MQLPDLFYALCALGAFAVPLALAWWLVGRERVRPRGTQTPPDKP